MIQPLDRRLLMASVSVFEGRLRIESTDQAEVVELAHFSKTQAQVFVDGNVALTFNLAEVGLLSFSGAGGDDTLILGRIPLKVYADGGDGRDAISTSQGDFDDTFIGGAGDDYCWAGPGNDSLVGGLGADGMFGFIGDDYFEILSDNTHDDTVSGGDGDDIVDGSRYPVGLVLVVGDRTPGRFNTSDFLYEDVERVLGSSHDDNIAVVGGRPLYVKLGDGNDGFTGGSANDTVIGGKGRDSLSGSSGDDVFNAADGQHDHVVGLSGNDTATADELDNVESVEDERIV